MLNYCGRYVSPARKRVFAQTVPRCTPYRRASVVTLMPCARAVRIASTSSAVSGVRVRPVGVKSLRVVGLGGEGEGLCGVGVVVERVEESFHACLG